MYKQFFFCVLLLLCLSACSLSGQQSEMVVEPKPTVSLQQQVAGMKLFHDYESSLSSLKAAGGDGTLFKIQYHDDRIAYYHIHTLADYNQIVPQIESHIASVDKATFVAIAKAKLQAAKDAAYSHMQKVKHKVKDFQDSHPYHDPMNGVTYHLGYEYDGDIAILQQEYDVAKSITDYNNVVSDSDDVDATFSAMVQNTYDGTTYSSPHQTDGILMTRYEALNQAIVVSLQEQALRVYDHGHLIHSMLVTTGRPEAPSLPGSWWIEQKKSPDLFKSGVPKGDPEWYPDTKINYSLLYHSGGYYLHDAYWRSVFGKWTQFPHSDGLAPGYSDRGSHGCVNLPLSEASWLYGWATMSTPVIVY